MPWIGFDLDGTLAVEGPIHQVGAPIPAMVTQLQAYLIAGREVRIFTARVGDATNQECREALEAVGIEGGELSLEAWHSFQRSIIDAWCLEVIGRTLPITAAKDFHMLYCYDDRCVQVVPNTGRTLAQEILSAIVEGHKHD